VVADRQIARPAKRIRVVVTCTHRKTRPVPASLHLRGVTSLRTPTRLRTWMTRLAETSVSPAPALDLYSGEHWDVARRLAQTSPTGAAVELWVCSAGYGLIPATAPIVPYAATFAVGNPDSVPNGAAGATAWWDALSEWKGPTGGSRTLSDLVGSDSKSRVLLVLSATYVNACREDISRAVARIADTKQLSIISAGTRDDGEFKDFLLPCDARLQTAVGGTRQALNVRAAEYLLAANLVDHDEMSDALAKLLADQPAVARYERLPASDAEVRAFIRARLRTNPAATHTRLLREFRDENRACEQSRFAGLFVAETGVHP
jgi:hypothetical protein